MMEEKARGIMKCLLICIIMSSMLIIAGCAQDISEVKQQDNVGDTVTVKGTVQNTIKLGKLSGYQVKDETGTIGVSSEALPAEGSEVTVKGTLIKDTLLGYYIDAS
ncbi:hypothetical protein GF345_06485 [Candidatus Woesearchaeota archaeon]|nr:hypothetical protein [Candidatus Woesearchaeota archaeon]